MGKGKGLVRLLISDPRFWYLHLSSQKLENFSDSQRELIYSQENFFPSN